MKVTSAKHRFKNTRLKKANNDLRTGKLSTFAGDIIEYPEKSKRINGKITINSKRI